MIKPLFCHFHKYVRFIESDYLWQIHYLRHLIIGAESFWIIPGHPGMIIGIGQKKIDFKFSPRNVYL